MKAAARAGASAGSHGRKRAPALTGIHGWADRDNEPATIAGGTKLGNAETYLQERGCHTTGAFDADLFAAAGLAKPAVEFGAGVEGVVYVTATRR